MKFLQGAMIGTMLLSVGGTFAFAPDAVHAQMTNQDVGVTQVEFAKLTESLSTYSYDDVRADHWAYSSIQWAAKNNLFDDGGQGHFNPNAQVSEEQLVNVLANYFNINTEDTYKEFAKYQISLNAYNDTTLRTNSIKKGQFAQVVAELSGERGTLEDSIRFLDKAGIEDVEEEESLELTDLYGAELAVNKAQLAVLVQKLSNRNISLSNESAAIYATNKDKSEKELFVNIDTSNTVSLIGSATAKADSEITTVGSKFDDAMNNLLNASAQKDQKEKFFANLEKTNPPKQGDKIKSYKETGTYSVKSGKFYSQYQVTWKSGKKTNANYMRGTATNAEQNMYSTSGNKVDKGVVVSAKQKAIIKTLKAKYGTKYRYLVHASGKKDIGLSMVPNDGKTFAYHLDRDDNLTFYTAKYFILGGGHEGTKASAKKWFNIAYNIGMFPSVGTKAGWEKRAVGNVITKYHGYSNVRGYGLIFTYEGK